MTRVDESFFRDYLRAWGDGDIDALMRFFTDDVMFLDTTTGHGASGVVRMRRFAEASFAAYPDSRFELIAHVCDGHSFAMEWVMHPAGIAGVSFGRVNAGRIAEQRDYWNGRSLP